MGRNRPPHFAISNLAYKGENMKDKMKRMVSLALALMMVLLTFSACTENSEGQVNGEMPEQQKELKLWWAYNTENFMQDYEYDYDRDSTLRMHGIKGDVESVQLMITPDKDIVSFDFTMADLTAADGGRIGAEAFEIYAEAYVNVDGSYNADSYYGYYPDALVPLENYKFRRHNSIAAGDNQGIWINVNIDPQTAAGTYTGNGTLTLDGEDYLIPVELTVYDVTMPEQVHAESAFLVWYDHIQYGEGRTGTELFDSYFWFLVDKRIMPCLPEDSKTADYAAYVEYMAENLTENPKISSYGLPYRVNKVNNVNHLDKDSVVELLTLMAQKNIALREAGNENVDLFKKCYYYLGSVCDEPSGVEEYNIVRESDLMITEAKFQVAELLNDYPDLKESLLSLRHIVTATYADELVGSDTVGGVQTWCPQFQHFNTDEQRANMAARQESTERLMGENVWWYGCMHPQSPYPTYHLDDELITSRIVSWMQYDYGIEGNLYWCVNFYMRYANGSTVARDVWEDPEVVLETPGDGYLLYPGREYGVDGPISTMRLESIRESNEDYEYFWLFEQKINEYNEAHGTDIDANTLLQNYFGGLYQGTIPENDTEAFALQRIELLKALQALYQDVDAAVESLTK